MGKKENQFLGGQFPEIEVSKINYQNIIRGNMNLSI